MQQENPELVEQLRTQMGKPPGSGPEGGPEGQGDQPPPNPGQLSHTS